jgi:penicillin-binding protein 2
MFAVPANGGYLVQPHLLLQPNDTPALAPKSLDIKPEHLKLIRTGLRQVVDGGTGAAMNVPTIPPSAGKSGTAEAPPKAVHVWFGAYAPIDDPEIVVVAFGEHLGGGGGKVAAPMVLKVMETYFPQKTPPNPKTPAGSPPKPNDAGQ